MSKDKSRATTDLVELEQVADRYSPVVMQSLPRFERMLKLAEGMGELRSRLMPLMGAVLPLAGSALGFKTDKSYPPETICECLIEATMRGVYPVGNEWNIISGRCYITKEGYTRLVRELPGLTDLRLMPGVPKILPGGAVVPFKASWRLDGKAHTIERQIPVRLNTGMGADGALGKATRKMLAAIYAQCTGSYQSEAEDDAGDLSVGQSRTDRLADKMGVPGKVLLATNEQLARMRELIEASGITEDGITELMNRVGCTTADALTSVQASQVIAHLEIEREDAAAATA